MFPEFSPCVNGQESDCPFRVNANESEYSKIGESGNIDESGKISSRVNLALQLFYILHRSSILLSNQTFEPSKSYKTDKKKDGCNIPTQLKSFSQSKYQQSNFFLHET